MGGYVKTSGVNSNPVNDDQKFYLDFYFYDKQGNLIGGQPVRVYVPRHDIQTPSCPEYKLKTHTVYEDIHCCKMQF